MAALALLKIVSGNGQFQLTLNAGIALNAVGIIIFPTALIGVCGKATMHCHEVTQPTLIVLGILIILATLIQTVVLVTHDGESLKKCDEIFFMRK